MFDGLRLCLAGVVAAFVVRAFCLVPSLFRVFLEFCFSDGYHGRALIIILYRRSAMWCGMTWCLMPLDHLAICEILSAGSRCSTR